MFNFLCCCSETQSHNNLKQSEEEIEENKNLVKMFNGSNKYLRTSANRTDTKASTLIEMEEIKQPIKKNPKVFLNDSWLIRAAELNVEFSQKGLIDHYNNLEQTRGLDKFYEKNNLTLFYKKNGNGSDIGLGKSFYKMSKKAIYTSKDGKSLQLKEEDKITLNDIKDYVYLGKLRSKWDKSVKLMKIYDKDGRELQDLTESHGNNFFLIYAQFNSPAFFISKRDVFCKNITFMEDNCIYSYGSTIEEKANERANFFVKESEDFVRCVLHVNMNKYEEDEEYFYFSCLNHTDIKLPMSESLMNFVIPFKMTSYYSDLLNGLKEEVKIRHDKYAAHN